MPDPEARIAQEFAAILTLSIPSIALSTTMLPYQREFLELALRKNALRFGEFTLKSGRISPYFFNAGRFDSGDAGGAGACLCAIGDAIEAAVRHAVRSGLQRHRAGDGDGCALARDHGRDVPVAFNRKEAKDHGEGGMLIGAPLKGRVLIVDDVITAGTAIRESLALIREHGAEPAGVLIALDRQERGAGARSAAQEITAQFGIPVIAIARLGELLTLAAERPELQPTAPKLDAYRARLRQRGVMTLY